MDRLVCEAREMASKAQTGLLKAENAQYRLQRASVLQTCNSKAPASALAAESEDTSLPPLDARFAALLKFQQERSRR